MDETRTLEPVNQGLGPLLGIFALSIPILLLIVVSSWKLFEKADKPGWAALVPVYNVVVFLQIVGRPTWWIALMFVPVVSLIVAFVLSLNLAERFGKGAGFGIALALLGPIFLPILAFSSAQYDPPDPL